MKLLQIIKRLLDLLTAIVIMILLLPVLILVGLAILILEGWPILYVSKRYISLTKAVSIIKFRTMVKDAASSKYNLTERFMKDGYLDIPLSCEVYTKIGKILERLQVVEILQVLNIIFHGMSFIGNRPLPYDNIKLLQKFPNWEDRFNSPAGITGIAQVVGKLNLQPHDRLKLEILYSKVYQDGNIILCDFFIVCHTIRLILLGKALPFDNAINLLQKCMKNTTISTLK